MHSARRILQVALAGMLAMAVTLPAGVAVDRVGAPARADHTPPPTTVTIAGTLQSELGCPGDWQPECEATQLVFDANDDVWQNSWSVPAGDWAYKAALNGNWDESYGWNGGDITFVLAEPTEVKFYYDHDSHWVTDSVNSRIVTAPGSYQDELGCSGDWDPGCLRSWLQDPDGDGTSSFSTTDIPAGNYGAKAAINESWDENYGAGGVPGGDDIPFSVPAAGSTVTFSFVSSTNVLSISVAPPGGGASHDNDIWWDDLGHDSRDTLYRTPNGPVTTGTPVKLRLRAASGDLTAARVRVWNDRPNTQSLLNMSRVADDGTHEWWEATVPASNDTTIFWYRFIAIDGSATAFYEDDEARTGGWGMTYASSPDISWQLSVYDPAFQTPDWVKNATIYQIYPDRFRNGDPVNDPDEPDFFYEEAPTLWRSGASDWNTPICDPRNMAISTGNCNGIYSQNFYGGDLAGITHKLDYLQDLGVTALYLNPIFDSPSNHKYDTTDFTQIDPAFGTQAEFEALSSALHTRDMHLILDGVFNHSSSDSLYFDRYSRYTSVGACEDPTSPYRDWYYFHTVTPGSGACVGDDGTPNGADYESWFGYDSLPKLDATNQEVRDFFYAGGANAVGPYWLTWADGWRLDVAGDVDPGVTNDPSNDYWEGFRDAVRAKKSDAYIVGEEWGNASAWTLGDEWDATMNYQLSSALLSFYRDTNFTDNDHNTASSAGVLAPISPSTLAERILNLQERYPPEAYAAMMNLLGSHDTNRPLFMLDHNADQNSRALYENPSYDWSDAINRLKGVALLQGTLPGAPTIYYGDEIGLVAPPTYDGSTWQDDPYNRIPYPWLDETGTPYYVHLQTAGGQQLLLDHYTAVFSARQAHPALRTGDLRILATDDAAKVFAYGRRMADSSDAAVVVVNRSGQEQVVGLDVAGYLPVGTSFSDVLGGDPATVGATGTLEVTVPAGGGALLVLQGTMAAAPAAVTDLQVTGVSASSISLDWSASAGADEYDVFRSLLSGGGYELADTTSNTSFTDTGLDTATAYHYVVVARDTATLLESGHSNEVSAVTGHDLGTAWYNLQWPPTIEHTISTTTRTENIYGQIYIAGVTDPPGQAPGIRAQVGYGTGTTPDNTWTWEEMSFNTQSGNNDEYVGSLLPDAVGTFNYATRYSTNNGATWSLADLSGPRPDGTLSNPGVLTVNASSDTTPPAAPELSLVGNTASSISLSWTAPTDPDLAGYELFRDGAEIAQFGASATSYTDEDVTTGQTYTYTVRAFDTSFNRSADSNEVEATAENRMVQVTFTVAVPEFTPADATIYVTGSISQLGPWNPIAHPMTENSDGTWSQTFSIPDGTSFEWKYTRGSWETVEQWGDITGVANRGPATAQYGTDGTMTIDNTATSGPASYQQIGNWRDPLVVSHSPEDGATDVPTDTTVVVNWSKPMPSSTAFSVKDGEGVDVAGSFALSNGDQTVTFTPDSPLAHATTYDVLVTGQGGGGDIQQVPTSFSFTTVEAPEPVLESITVNPVDPTLVRNSNERFTATGVYDDDSEADLTWQVTWSTSDKKVANVNPIGLVQPKAVGSATITATLGEIEGQSLVTVVARR